MAKASSASKGGGRYRPRRIELAAGERLVLHGDGTIEHQDAAGAVTETWSANDPEWPRHALRFGLHEERRTIKPTGRDEPGPRLPG